MLNDFDVMSILKESQFLEKGFRGKFLYATKFGSMLYGTNSESSDTDIKCIYLPDIKDVLMGKELKTYSYQSNKTSKNTADDIDIEFKPLQTWLKELARGDAGAIDILFSKNSEESVVYADDNFIQNMPFAYEMYDITGCKSFLGYVKSQSLKYTVKAQNLKFLRELNKDLASFIDHKGMQTALAFFIDRYKFSYGHLKKEHQERYHFDILGSLFQLNLPVSYVKDWVEKKIKSYGNRTEATLNSEKSIDWKALSHSVRCCLEVEELLTGDSIYFPLLKADYVKSVKYGHVSLEEVLKFIDEKLLHVETLMETYVSKYDGRKVEEFVRLLYGL